MNNKSFQSWFWIWNVGAQFRKLRLPFISVSHIGIYENGGKKTVFIRTIVSHVWNELFSLGLNLSYSCTIFLYSLVKQFKGVIHKCLCFFQEVYSAVIHCTFTSKLGFFFFVIMYWEICVSVSNNFYCIDEFCFFFLQISSSLTLQSSRNSWKYLEV